MQIATAELRLGGESYTSVPLNNLTPAEAILLERIHGEGALVGVKTKGGQGLSDTGREKERLRARYRKHHAVIDELFPGLRPPMPETFEGLFGVVDAGHLTRPRKAKGDATPLPPVQEPVPAASDPLA